MTVAGGTAVHQARFLPFGRSRGWGSTPTAAWLDRGYTGHPSAGSGHACTMMGLG
ncbi:MAG: hypothetical protein OT477_06710 [Chloroflexi bacterium]|nr:hypothetical protein [Chloroflexota bacterium]